MPRGSTTARHAPTECGREAGAGAEQARPVEGRSYPAKALGARPTFFDDDGATDAVVDIVTALAAEVWALRERVDTLEHLLADSGAIEPGAVEAEAPDPGREQRLADEASAFTARVFRVFEEMREQAVAGETGEQYRSVVQRAFDEI